MLRADAAEAWTENVRLTRELFAGLPAAASVTVARSKTLGAIQVALHDAVYAALLTASRAKAKRRSSEPDTALDQIPSTATALQAETAKILAIGQLHQLDLDIAQGSVIGIAPLLHAMSEPLSTVRQRMLWLEANLPPRLIGLDQRAADKVIQAAVGEALEDLSEDLPAPGKHAAEEGQSDDTADRDVERIKPGSRSKSPGGADRGHKPETAGQRSGTRAR